jgi:hypothetical protein
VGAGATDSTIWESSLAVGEPHAPYMGAIWSHVWMAPYGSHMCHMGAMWELCVLCEPCSLYWSHMAPFERQMVTYGSHTCCIGATHTIREPHARYGGHMGAMCTHF